MTAASWLLPFYLAAHLAKIPIQRVQLAQSFSLILLGATVSTLSTINFSLALIVGLLCSPLNFIRPLPYLPPRSAIKSTADGSDYLNSLAVILPSSVLYLAISPPVVLYAVSGWLGRDIGWVLGELAKGWVAQGVWSCLVIWAVWWPAWILGGGVLWNGVMRGR